jgi:hypothetical protein
MGTVTTAELPTIVKRFDRPERVLLFESGRFEVITVGGRAIVKGTYAPGWRWSRLAAAARNGLAGQVGVVLSGRAKIRVQDGQEIDITPGDFFHITTEHEAWVVGYRPCEILYLIGVEALIERFNRRQ